MNCSTFTQNRQVSIRVLQRAYIPRACPPDTRFSVDAFVPPEPGPGLAGFRRISVRSGPPGVTVKIRSNGPLWTGSARSEPWARSSSGSVQASPYASVETSTGYSGSWYEHGHENEVPNTNRCSCKRSVTVSYSGGPTSQTP